MAVTAMRATAITLQGDVMATINANAATNSASPGKVDLVTLAVGDNTITPPAGGSTPVACTIMPPSGNTQTITLKGIGADTGVVLHRTDPTSLALNSPTTPFVLTCAGAVTGCRLVWT
jgi:hypothetical protein